MEWKMICRTCLKTYETLWNIFENKQKDKSISELIMECVPITIGKDDKFPVYICDACLRTLNSLLEFKEMVIKSHQVLTESIENNKELSCVTDIEKMIIKEETDLDVYIKNESFDENIFNLGDDNTMSAQKMNVESNSDISLDKDQENLKINDNKKQINKKRGSSNIHCLNEEELKILDNPDCIRIIQSTMSSGEKAKAQVYCKNCNKSYTFKYYIAVHAHTHIGNLPYKCELCDFRVPKKYLLHQHMRTHAPTKDFLCSLCGRAFSSQQILNAHKLRHTDERPFKCKICQKAFKQLVDLQQHEVGHTDVKKYVCEECGKSFKYKKNLSDHQAGHTNERNFECTTCGKRFIIKKRLDEHVKKHLGLKPYACDVCGKTFTTKPTWQRHARIHTGEKPYSCDICGKKFRQQGCMVRHVRTHTGEAPYSCKYCPETFKYSQYLSNHMEKHKKVILTLRSECSLYFLS
ncbi:zinc finger protein [Holotrichia oblita]|uniref:Zinc finger protein n=1 Tax=Holotrichia oblita TaxID=644536 RepID=A0ACB9T1G7_HOLOL|nr:zinc finger protein [Holotrichia oblita]